MTMSPGIESRASNASRTLALACLGAVLVFGAIYGFREITSPDLGFHLGTARWIIDNGSFPHTDPFTYTVTDHAYVDLQWLFQLSMYALVGLAGTAGVVLATILLTLVFGALLLLRARRRDGTVPLSTGLLLLLFFLGNYWEPRPHLLSWVLGAALLLVLDEASRGARRWLPLVPVILLLWVNAHSLFVLGLVIAGAYAGMELIRGRRRDTKLIAWCAAGFAVCLLNPYHVHGLLFPLVQLRDIQAGSGYKSTATGIAEFTTPFAFDGFFVDGRFVLFQPKLFWILYAITAVAGVWGNRRELRLVDWGLLAAFFYVFATANKNFGYFVMVSLPLVASGLDRVGASVRSVLSRGGDADGTKADAWRRRTLATFGVVVVMLVVPAATGGLYRLSWSVDRHGTGFNASALPVEACAFLEREGIEGRWLNSWDHGGYILWTTGQPVFVYSHGEVMGQEFYAEYVRGKEPEGFASLLEKWEPTVAVVPYRDAPYWLFHLNRASEWRMVHVDDVAAVFLERDVAPNVRALPDPAPGTDYPVFDRPTTDTILADATKRGKPGWITRLRGNAALPLDAMSRSAFFLQTGEPDACIGVALEAVRDTSFVVPELMLNLGHAFEAKRSYDRADLCFDAFLRVDDDPYLAAAIRNARNARK